MQPKKLGKYLMGACALFLMGNNVWAAQTVKYSIRWDYNADRYRVYMMPTATPAGTYGDQTLTSQVTVRVTHKTGAQRFDMADLVAKVDKTMWTGDEDEARVDAPTEKPDMDYISMELGIKGTDRSIFHWQANQEQEVFSFVNAAGCIGTVEIMPDDDPFDPKNIASGRNSSGTNPGNQITNLGWGTAKDNNFLSVYGAPADCTLSNDTDHDGLKDGQEKEIVGSPYDNPDYDGDGKLDGAEVGADIYHPTDTDGDSIPDWKESAITDTDKDGIVDELDPDNNNACVPSVKAGACDQDGDGKPNSTDTDDDGDGVSDTVETALGTDPNDADSDNTNTPSVNEGTAGVQQGKSASDDSTTDTDGDGKTDATECSPLTAAGACKDTDGDGIPDWKESAITDTDKDGTPDELDKDNNNACVPDVKAATCDLDGDGIPNSTDTDADGDGVPNTVETALGTDPYDADSDNTNTPSVNEGTAGVQQGKSASDDSTTDTDGDGKTDATECSPLTASGACKDTDGDGIPDWKESAITDTDKDGTPDELDKDNNNACVPDVKAATCDLDGDGIPNSTDTDADGDGVPNTVETALGTDPYDADSDNTNTPSVNEGTTGVQQGKSASDDSTTDTDGDGKTNAAECSPLTASGACKDTDGDGIPDWQESAIIDTDKDGIVDELDPDNNTPIAVNVQVKVMLQGPYDSASGTMQDTLRSKGLIPTAQPYNNSSFLYTGTETASASLLASTDSHNAPVDWVLVELRDASKPYTVLASKAALVQRDGDVMDAATGSTNLSFTKMQPGNYYVSVRHRNHLGAMTQKAMSLAPSPVTAVDFSNPATLTWGSNARLSSSSISLLWSGNADMNWYAIASGPGNDTTTVLFSIWGAAGNTTGSTNYILPGYASTDFNLDGRTIYSGNGNDVNILLANVLLHPGNGSLSANYIITQQIPIAP